MGRQIIKRNRAQCQGCMTILESTKEDDLLVCACKNLVVGGGLVELYRSAQYISKLTEMSEFEFDPTQD
jgi:hypothetical protein